MVCFIQLTHSIPFEKPGVCSGNEQAWNLVERVSDNKDQSGTSQVPDFHWLNCDKCYIDQRLANYGQGGKCELTP